MALLHRATRIALFLAIVGGAGQGASGQLPEPRRPSPLRPAVMGPQGGVSTGHPLTTAAAFS